MAQPQARGDLDRYDIRRTGRQQAHRRKARGALDPGLSRALMRLETCVCFTRRRLERKVSGVSFLDCGVAGGPKVRTGPSFCCIPRLSRM